jgi:hypothetical protein
MFFRIVTRHLPSRGHPLSTTWELVKHICGLRHVRCHQYPVEIYRHRTLTFSGLFEQEIGSSSQIIMFVTAFKIKINNLPKATKKSVNGFLI